MDSSSANALDAALDPAFSGMSFAEVCALASRLQNEVRHAQALNAKMAHEMAVLKRLKFAASAERFSLEQRSLLQEAIDEDLQALEREVDKLQSPAGEKQTPEAPGAAGPPATPRHPPRTRRHHLHHTGLRLPDEAHRPRHGREAGL
ncbi:hypothetical protein GCM10007320_53890 [Pseudorhodoferax aquiterrae]|uniref:Transposase TnpC homeodomain domain-containing protein n=1 Tax=Pseudorhodoferax aquiterrae TaxID=747304 RepID=A0ABQ3G966_9BURK|nr:hypothetical protein GCM10007320_53890 [Pseudorhodoferax aquiterrae]